MMVWIQKDQGASSITMVSIEYIVNSKRSNDLRSDENGFLKIKPKNLSLKHIPMDTRNSKTPGKYTVAVRKVFEEMMETNGLK